jgi:hypothetical protein
MVMKSYDMSKILIVQYNNMNIKCLETWVKPQ